jgi:hypothetical protein
MFKKILAATGVIVIACMISSMQMQCKKPNDNTPACDTLTVKKPNGGETYKVGDTMLIEWCYSEPWKYTTMMRFKFYYTPKTYFEPVEGTITAYPIAYPNNTYKLVLTSQFVGDSCKMWVQDYDGNAGDISDNYFRVIP